jgi:hypothetical protein
MDMNSNLNTRGNPKSSFYKWLRRVIIPLILIAFGIWSSLFCYKIQTKVDSTVVSIILCWISIIVPYYFSIFLYEKSCQSEKELYDILAPKSLNDTSSVLGCLYHVERSVSGPDTDAEPSIRNSINQLIISQHNLTNKVSQMQFDLQEVNK